MLRIFGLHRRTSRKGPGGWTTPSFVTPGQRLSTSFREAPSCKIHDHRASSTSVPKSATDVYSEPREHSREGRAPLGNPHISDWRTSPAFTLEAIGRHFLGDRLYQSAFGFSSCPSQAAAGAGVKGGGRSHSAQQEAARGTVAEPRAHSTNWTGGPVDGSTMLMRRHFGVNNFSMVDRQQLTLTKLLHLMMDATFKPRDTDSRVFGGDNRSKLAEQKEELKLMDSRIVPFAHEHIMFDYLKNIDQLHSPSGKLCSRDILRGRLVGILFFTESERSLSFMRVLRRFHQNHSPDFVVVSISLGGKEMLDLAQQHGFFHCIHRDGATWVQRDSGLMVRPWTPMPRLLIVDGTTGMEITRCGLTAVTVRPDTCMAEWKKGNSGVGTWDWLHALYL